MNRKAKALEFANEPYNIMITGRHVQVTDAMKDYALDKISKIERFNNRIIDVWVTMDIQRVDHKVDIVLKIDHIKIKSSAVSEDMYISIDRAIAKLKEQIRRYKNKINDYQARGAKFTNMNVDILKGSKSKDEDLNEFNDDIEAENHRSLEDGYRPHQIVKRETRPLKTLTYDEAIMKIELSGDNFLIFVSEADKKLKVIYRRNDGDFGIIEPQ